MLQTAEFEHTLGPQNAYLRFSKALTYILSSNDLVISYTVQTYHECFLVSSNLMSITQKSRYFYVDDHTKETLSVTYISFFLFLLFCFVSRFTRLLFLRHTLHHTFFHDSFQD